MTGIEIQKLILQNETLTFTASRLYGNCYGVGVQYANGDYVGPVTLPENNQPLQFDSLDQVAAFLTQIGVKSFQVAI